LCRRPAPNATHVSHLTARALRLRNSHWCVLPILVRWGSGQAGITNPAPELAVRLRELYDCRLA
jgi:hypothetical protein